MRCASAGSPTQREPLAAGAVVSEVDGFPGAPPVEVVDPPEHAATSRPTAAGARIRRSLMRELVIAAPPHGGLSLERVTRVLLIAQRVARSLVECYRRSMKLSLFFAGSLNSRVFRTCLAASMVVACGATATPEQARVELLGTSADRILGIAADGDAVLVARESGLDRVDAAGAVTRIAGAEYRSCPEDVSVEWNPGTEDRFGGASFAVRDRTLTFADGRCGVWTRQLDGGATKMLISSRATGNGAPVWMPAFTAVSVDDAEVFVCFTSGGPQGLKAELWSVARDGTNRNSRVAELTAAETCGAVLSDAANVFVVARSTPERDVVYRIGRGDRNVTELSSATSFTGIAQDDAALYLIRDGSVVKVEKNGPSQSVLTAAGSRMRPGQQRGKDVGPRPDKHLAIDGDFLYWFGTRSMDNGFRHTIERIRVVGGEPEAVFDQDNSSGLWPAHAMAIGAGYTYFAWWEMPGQDRFSIARVQAVR
jgi:hypothetical protein